MAHWKHVLPVLERDGTYTLYTTRWGASPVGPRLEKGLAMPSLPYAGLKTPAEALTSAEAFDAWLERQQAGERDTRKAKPSEIDHYGGSKPAVQQEMKPAAPAATPPPAARAPETKPAPKPAPAAPVRKRRDSGDLFKLS